MLENIVQDLLAVFEKLGHWGVFFMMVIESSFFPLPSEIVVPPAAYLAQQGKLNIYLVIVAGTLGSMVGALFNYYLALFLGRPLIYRLINRRAAKMIFLSETKLHRAEEFFVKYGNIATFVGRLLPGVRHLISIPAGFVKMPIKNFLFFTFLGAMIWVTVLAFQGYLVGVYKDLFVKYLFEIIAGIIVFVLSCWFLWRHLKKRKYAH